MAKIVNLLEAKKHTSAIWHRKGSDKEVSIHSSNALYDPPMSYYILKCRQRKPRHKDGGRAERSHSSHFGRWTERW